MDLRPVLLEPEVPLAHLGDHDVGESRQVGRLEPDSLRLLDRSADDAAHHVAAALVRGGDAVRCEERHPAPVVGENPMRLRRLK